MKRKIITLVLALTITVSTVTGCGSTESATAPSENYVQTEEATAEYFAPADDYSSSSKPAKNDASIRNDVEVESVAEACEESTAAVYDTARGDAYIKADDIYYGEKYESTHENGFMSASANPLSTFAADVDTASYSNMRRMVEYGYGISDFPAGSVRAEEMINYFTYNYSKPDKNEVFGVEAQIADCPWNEDNKLMVLGITTQSLKRRETPDSNIVFLVDVSGSMHNSNKLPLLKEAMELMVDNLSENDRVSIVTYASGTDVVLEGVAGDKKTKIMRAFNGLSAGGSTNGAGGIELAYEVAEDNFIKGGNNRVIIASDGDFNVGKTSKDDLYKLISKKKDSGIFLSVLGFGMGNYNDVTMETLADNGNGNYAYIDSLSEAKKVLVDEFDSTLYTVAKDTKFQVEFNPALVTEYRQIGYENRALAAEDFTDDTKDGGELGSGRQITVMYELVLAGSKKGTKELKYQESNLSDKGEAGDEWCTLSIAYKDPDEDESEYREYPIGIDNYSKRPSDDFKFAAAVAQVAMALNDSAYLVDFDRYDAVSKAYYDLSELDMYDDYREEFYDIVEELAIYR